MRLGDLDNLKNKFWHGDLVPNKDMYHISEIMYVIDNTEPVIPEEFKPLIDKVVEILPDLTNAIIEQLPRIISSKIKCSECSYYKDTWNVIPRPHGEWIPIKYRPMTTDERNEFAEYYGVEFCDTLVEKVFDCTMPEDGQKILISSSWGVSEDVADNDIAGEGFTNYGLEANGDWDGVDAWMPLPEPYKKDGGADDDK